MSRNRRQRLAPVAVAELFAGADDLIALDRSLVQAGYRRPETIQPYLSRRDMVTFRIVWRRRVDGISWTVQHAVRIPVSDVLSTA